jgi:transposase
MLERWPTANALAEASRKDLVGLARSCRHGWPGRFADTVEAALGAEQLRPKDYLVRAKADTIRLTATQLLAIGRQRRAWERRMANCCSAPPGQGRDHQPRGDGLGKGFSGGEIYLSFPGLGDRLAAGIAGEVGDHPEQFDTPNSLARYASKAPVTRRSGKSELVVACRLAHNRSLGTAVQQWAFCSLRRSG